MELTSRSTKKPEGFVCPSCGHLAVHEDETIGLTCPKCLQQWLEEQNVNQMVPISELQEERDSALVPTIVDVKSTDMKKMCEETTKIIKYDKELNTDSDDRIPGL
jgi:Zn-finger nucleic acid-binding protein